MGVRVAVPGRSKYAGANGDANPYSVFRATHIPTDYPGLRELLEGFAISDQQDFEAWLLTERETAKRTRAWLLHVLVSRLHAGGRNEAVTYARDLVAADPFSVAARAMLIRVLSAAGHRQEPNASTKSA